MTSFRTAKESVRASAEGVASAVAGLRVRKDLLDAGEATSNELLQAEAALRNAQLTSITALIATRVARAHLVHVVGDDVLGAQPSETRP